MPEQLHVHTTSWLGHIEVFNWHHLCSLEPQTTEGKKRAVLTRRRSRLSGCHARHLSTAAIRCRKGWSEGEQLCSNQHGSSGRTAAGEWHESSNESDGTCGWAGERETFKERSECYSVVKVWSKGDPQTRSYQCECVHERNQWTRSLRSRSLNAFAFF